MSDETKQRDEMVLLARSLFERGLTPGSSGNLSCRLEAGGFLMTPTNSSFGFLEADSLSKLDDNGHHVSGDKPTKEDFLHLAMYHGRTETKAVTHLHSTYCVCLSCMKDTDDANMLPPATPYVHMRVGPIAAAPYKRPGDRSLGPEIQKLAQKHSGIIIRNHGPVVAAKSIRDSVFAMEELEEAARIFLLTRGIDLNLLTDSDLAELDAIKLGR